MNKTKSYLLILTALFWVSFSLKAQKINFTVQDAIDVKSIGNQTLTEDGKYLAGLINDGSSRFNTDHFRFRDPSYLRVSEADLVIINTETGEEIRPYTKPMMLTNLNWSKDGSRLIFFQQKGEKLVLSTFDMKSKKTRDIKVSDSRIITDENGIQILPNGESVIIGLRKQGWLETAMAEYKEATAGPIVVYDGKAPFLKWDQIGNTSSLTALVKVDLKSEKVTDLLPESNYGGLRIDETGQYLSFNETFQLKTSYDRSEGASEYQTGFKDLTKSDSATVVYKRSPKRRSYNWDDAGSQFVWVDSGNVFLHSIAAIGNREPLNLTNEKAFEDDDKKKPVKFSIVRWHSQGKRLLLSSSKGWWTIDTDGNNLKMVYEMPKDKEAKAKAPNISVVNWSADGAYLYVSYSEKEFWKRGVQRYNINEGKFEDLMTDSNLYNGWRFAENGQKVVYNKSDGDRPYNLFANTLAFNSEKQLTDLNPWVANKKWTKTELISYRDADGVELKGILYYPVDYDPNKKYPLVLEVYETFFDNGYRNSMNLIANQGYFGLRPSVDLEEGYPGEAWVKGITSAINKLVDEGKVDNDKVGVQGVSYGGYASSLIITQTDRFAAAINISGKVNIISFLGDSPKIGTRNYSAAENGQDRIGGSFWDEPLKYFQTSAVFFADRIKTPHLLLTGEGDWNVPGTNTRELYYAMRRLDKDVTWVNYMKGGHGAGWASNEADYHDQWKRIFDFYAKHFAPKEKKD
ncbi:MAG: dipeptidyl aminopeptidase/acylaminoacyl peptidase [Roseivirga sp.]|jgi:dipeptidyl aminopeptidase/acylaminoacyl peptidase